jgi:hypothetical protein
MQTSFPAASLSHLACLCPLVHPTLLHFWVWLVRRDTEECWELPVPSPELSFLTVQAWEGG